MQKPIMDRNNFVVRIRIGIYITIFTFVAKSKSQSILSNCLLPTNSPQFATICRLPDTPLGDALNITANMICDYDCRCTHGANTRGGRCGTPFGRKALFCVCDYQREPPRDPLLELPSLGEGEFLERISNIPVLGTGLLDLVIPSVINNLCAADCRCSHGYPDNVGSEMSIRNGDTNNKRTFCICGNGKNLRLQKNE